MGDGLRQGNRRYQASAEPGVGTWALNRIPARLVQVDFLAADNAFRGTEVVPPCRARANRTRM
jgi:hypothetical protein